MPRGPKGEKRPADVIGNAIKVARIATGEESDPLPLRQSEAGKVGGKRRAATLTPNERSAIAKRASKARWKAD
jgi:hypothetical protein